MPGEKTEKATPKRKQDERKKGNVFFSREAVTVATLLASFYGFRLLAPSIVTTLEEMIAKYIALGAGDTPLGAEGMRELLVDGCLCFAKTALPLLLICCAAAVLITMAQTKMLFSTKAIAFKGERINPLSGLKKMFSMQGLVELVKAIAKICVLGAIIYAVLRKELFLLPRLMDMGPGAALARTGELVMSIVSKAGVAFLALAAADYLYQWWHYEKNLRMTKQEIKEEYKELEGDPQVKGRIRNLQQQRARRRMMQNVPSADVVIRNPTHFAVAIRYDMGRDRAPVVVAKGADSLALRIVSVAQEHGVYVTENKPLARALYQAVEVEQEIPEEFYQALAQVLAFVYSLKKKEWN